MNFFVGVYPRHLARQGGHVCPPPLVIDTELEGREEFPGSSNNWLEQSQVHQLLTRASYVLLKSIHDSTPS